MGDRTAKKFAPLVVLVVGIIIVSIATWLLGAFRDAQYFVPINLQLELQLFGWQKVSFIPQHAYIVPNIPKEWIQLVGYIEIPDGNQFSATDMPYSIYFNVDNGTIATTCPKPSNDAIVEVQINNRWVAIENYLDTKDPFSGKMIANDGARIIAGLYTDKTNLLVWNRLSEKVYTIQEPDVRAVGVTSPNLDYIAYSIDGKKKQMQILNVTTAGCTVFWETDERMCDLQWVNATIIGCTTYSNGLIFPLNAITQKHNYSIVLCDLEHNVVVNGKIPFTIPKTGLVFFDSTGNYAYYLSGSKLQRVTLR